MNEKKQGGFKISFLIGFLLIVLLFSLLFIDFGNNGQQLSQDEVFQIVDGTYQEDGTAKQATFIYYKNGKGYILVNDSKYKENQVPSYSDYYFKYDASGADGFIADVRQACQTANVKIAFAPTGMSFWDIFVPILYVCFAIFVFWMLFRMLKGANGNAMNFGKTKVKSYAMSKVKF